MSKLAYSIHLGNDKNKTKKAKESKIKNGTSLNNNAIQNTSALSKVNNHNLRKYEDNFSDNKIITGTDNLVDDVKNLYLKEFEESRLNYNETQTRISRKIDNYFQYVNDSNKDLACEIILELGDMNFWHFKDKNYKYKMIDVYKEQLRYLQKILPEFKIANAVIHFDELSPHVHIVGVPVKIGYTNGMKKQVAKSQIFTRTSLKQLQEDMRKHCIKVFNFVYKEEHTLKEKKQGRGYDQQSYDRNEMIELLEMEREHKELLEKVNNKVDNLDDKASNISVLLNELELTEKNDFIISKDSVNYINEYLEEYKDSTSTLKHCNEINSSIDKINNHLNNYDIDKEDLIYDVKQKDRIIHSLNNELNLANKTINTLKNKVKVLQEELYKFKNFFKRITSYFRNKIFKHDKDISNLIDDMKNNNVISINEFEHIVYSKKLDIENKNITKKEQVK